MAGNPWFDSLVVVLGLVLRIGVPLLITLGIGTLLLRREERMIAAAAEELLEQEMEVVEAR
jgi:hypothetical protein